MTEPKTELQANAINRARRVELLEYQRAQDIHWINRRMEDSGMARCLALIHKEAEMEKEYQERTDHAAIVNEKAKKETSLAIAVAEVRRKEQCELLRRHYIRENDHALKEFISKLERGYVCRDQKLQILNNEYKRLQNKAEEMYANKVLTESLFNEEQDRLYREKQKLDRTAAYCADIQQQMVNKQQQKHCQYEETLIEKKMLDEVIRTMNDEDQREIQKKRDEMEKLRREMVTFKMAQDAWKAKQKESLIIEERAIEQQVQAESDRSFAIIAEKRRQQDIKDAINFKISEKIRLEKEEAERRADLIRMLQEQENLEKLANEDLQEKEREERSKRETKAALMQQMNDRKKIAVQEKISDKKYMEIIQAEMSKDAEKERQKELLRKERQRQYTVDLMSQMREQEENIKKEKASEEARVRAILEYQRQWQSECDQEREKIVTEHCPPLLGYLQAGVLQHSDIPAVKRGAQNHPELAKLDIDSLAIQGPVKRFPKCNAQCRIIRDY